jgi:hypothetical protein
MWTDDVTINNLCFSSSVLSVHLTILTYVCRCALGLGALIKQANASVQYGGCHCFSLSM